MTSGRGFPGRTPLLATAGVAVGCGLLAALTGAGGPAVVAGAVSVVVAVLAVRSAGARDGAASSRCTDTPPTSERAAVRAPGSADPIPLPAAREPAPPVPPGSGPGPFAAPGMLTVEFFQTTLRSRVAVARRALRPLSLVYFEVLELAEPAGKRPLALDVVADALQRTLREADTAGVVAVDCYACILEDTESDGAVWTAERIRRNLADADPGRRFRAGVASYPNHGLDAAELQAKARTALDAARDWSRDRIEVATGAG